MEFFARRPLFYAALALCLVIFLADRAPDTLRNAFFRVWPDDVRYQTRDGENTVFLGGRIVTGVETRRLLYGDKVSSFVFEAKRIWVAEAKKAQNVRGRVRCFLKDPREIPAYGDEIVLRGDLKRPRGLRNPGGFDSRAYLERQGIGAVFYGDKNFDTRVLGRRKGNFLYEKALGTRRFLSERISRAFHGDEAAFLKALFLGERSDLEEEFKDLFIKTGTMHILAVSGFNIGFLCAALFLLLAPFPVSKNFKLCLALVAVWAYCLLVGWQAPVVRASLMASVFLTGRLLGRRTDALNSLGLAACVILILNPQQLFDVGFQLSFLAVFGLVKFVPLFMKRPELLPHEFLSAREKTVFYLKEVFWVSFVCAIVTLPITVHNFYIVTPLSVLSNLAVVPISFLLFLAGLLFFLSAAWLHPALSWLPFLMSGLMKLLIAALWAVEQMPGAYLIVGKPNRPFLILLVAGVCYFLTDKRMKSRTVRAAVIPLFLASVFLLQGALGHFNRPFKMTALDVGQGDSIYFEFPEGGNMLIDAGKGGDGDRGRRVIAPFLKSKGVSTIDLFVISHPQEDHIGGLPALLDEFRVKTVAEAGAGASSRLFGSVRQKIREENSDTLVVTRGDRLEGFKGVNVEVLNPSEALNRAKNINNASVVLKVVYAGAKFLLAGDMEKEAMRELSGLGADLKADVLKVPHHGGGLTEEGATFVRRVSPGISVISVGERNLFHHPAPRTLDILSSLPENKIFRTDRDGAVEIIHERGVLSVSTRVRS